MDADLEGMAVAKSGNEKVGVTITDDQTELEKQHASAPDGRTTTIPWENVAGDDGLNLKKQKRTEEDRQNEYGSSG